MQKPLRKKKRDIGGIVLMIVMIACLLAFSLKKKKN